MGKIRFAVLGAANIAVKFCDAVRHTADGEVVAVASKRLEKAEQFAKDNGVPAWYGDYEQMLVEQKPDAAYIAVTHNDHYRLLKLCISHRIPVLCEKCLCMDFAETSSILAEARAAGVFVMEAMWSRFLPPVVMVRDWIREGRIGTPRLAEFRIGFIAEKKADNRYYSRALGGGAVRDLGVYGLEMMPFMLDGEITDSQVAATWSETGVDTSNHISLQIGETLVDVMATIDTKIKEQVVVYGTEGTIVMPNSHFATECYLYDAGGALQEHFVDTVTPNGFLYEVEEAIRCIREGKLESEVVPHRLTEQTSVFYDRIEALRK